MFLVCFAVSDCVIFADFDIFLVLTKCYESVEACLLWISWFREVWF